MATTIDLTRFESSPLIAEPFPYLVLPGFVQTEWLDRIHAHYPQIGQPGSFPLSQLSFGVDFGQFISEITGPEMRAAFAKKFGIDLSNRPTMVTARGQCGQKDGRIHTDSKTKLITVLIYMNPSWEKTGGQLRLLRSGTDLESVILEVPPIAGTLLAFRRSDNSWHGHKPSAGPRRVIQLNWVVSQEVADREANRHRFSATVKRLWAGWRGWRTPAVIPA